MTQEYAKFCILHSSSNLVSEVLRVLNEPYCYIMLVKKYMKSSRPFQIKALMRNTMRLKRLSPIISTQEKIPNTKNLSSVNKNSPQTKASIRFIHVFDV